MICTITSCRGDSRALQSGNLVATLWLDSKVVTTMSTNCQPKEMGTVKRRQRDGSRIDVACPSAVVLYNRYMGGVDRNDQMRQYYHVRSRGRKYYRYIFWFLFETCVANSFILYRHFCTSHQPQTRKLKTYLDFRLQLYKELVGHYCSRRRPGRPAAGLSVQRPARPLPFQHFPVKRRTSSSSGRSRCWYCAHSRQPPMRNETTWFCTECNVHLCHTGEEDGSDCFLLYHTRYITLD